VEEVFTGFWVFERVLVAPLYLRIGSPVGGLFSNSALTSQRTCVRTENRQCRYFEICTTSVLYPSEIESVATPWLPPQSVKVFFPFTNPSLGKITACMVRKL